MRRRAVLARIDTQVAERTATCHPRSMQLRVARLCLDCEDVHDGQQCPVCASESFAYLSRWVPTPERRSQPRQPAEAREGAAAGTSRKQLVGYGVLGVGVVGLAQWFLKGRAKIEQAAARSESGELK
jgi:hypothetical protein